MKNGKIYTLALLLTLVFSSSLLNAQTAENKWGIGLNLNTTDYRGDIGNDFWSFDMGNLGFGVSVSRYLCPTFEVVADLSYLNTESTHGLRSFDADLFMADLNLKFKFNNGWLLKENSKLAPYLLAGGGHSYVKTKGFYNSDTNHKFDKSYNNANFFYGAGFAIKLNEKLALDLQGGIYYPLRDRYDGVRSKMRDTEKYNDKFMKFSAGIVYSLGKKSDTDGDGVSDGRDVCPDTPSGVSVNKVGCPIDTDNDGVADYMDACPMMAGSKMLKGCPDGDGDGVADNKDQCPRVAGKKQFKGCPDTDNDGVADKVDLCPNKKGTIALKGCPDSDGDGVADSLDKCPNTKRGLLVDSKGCASDRDNDGVVDRLDKCPNQAGPASNNGCPEIKANALADLQNIARNIKFSTGRDALTSRSVNILNEVVSIMKQNPAYSLRISGYTDSVGKEALNLRLSDKRANSTRNYLISRGVAPERIQAQGYGEANPIVTNKTSKGRAENRRVEFDLYL